MPVTLPSYKAYVTKSIVNIERLCCPYSPGYQRVTKTQSVYPTAPSFPSIPPKFLPFPFSSSFPSPQETHPDISHFTPPLPPPSHLVSSYVIMSCQSVIRMSMCHVISSCLIVMSYCHTYTYKLNTISFG